MYEQINSRHEAPAILYGGGCAATEMTKYNVERYVAWTKCIAVLTIWVCVHTYHMDEMLIKISPW